jgi:hypothetical protein
MQVGVGRGRSLFDIKVKVLAWGLKGSPSLAILRTTESPDLIWLKMGLAKDKEVSRQQEEEGAERSS